MQTLDSAVKHAAQYLPSGWTIDIYVEKGSSWVLLEDPDGDGVPIESGDLTLAEQILSAVDQAIDMEENEDD